MALLLVLGLVLAPAEVLGNWIQIPPRDDARVKPSATKTTRVTITTRGNATGSARADATVSRKDTRPEPVECGRDCCPVGMFCSGCGQCFPEGSMPPLCGFPPGVQVSCCDDDGNPCTRCNEDCCLGTDQCSCKGTCVAEGEPMPACGPDDYNDINGLPLVNCCDGDAGADRCAVLPPDPPALSCRGDCCPAGSACIGCGSCVREGDPVPMCDWVPGLSLSCCKEDAYDAGDDRCTVCNEDCCLGSDQCSCKGECVAEGEPMPECGPDDYYEETGFPKKNCCGDQVGLERCADIPRPVTCKEDCCPVGMKCDGCGSCVLESDESMCVGYFPGAQVSCCDDVGNPCTRCNDKCCIGTDKCSCKGTCVAEGEPMPTCGPDDYNDINGLPKVHCCQGEAGPERCAVV